MRQMRSASETADVSRAMRKVLHAASNAGTIALRARRRDQPIGASKSFAGHVACLRLTAMLLAYGCLGLASPSLHPSFLPPCYPKLGLRFGRRNCRPSTLAEKRSPGGPGPKMPKFERQQKHTGVAPTESLDVQIRQSRRPHASLGLKGNPA